MVPKNLEKLRNEVSVRQGRVESLPFTFGGLYMTFDATGRPLTLAYQLFCFGVSGIASVSRKILRYIRPHSARKSRVISVSVTMEAVRRHPLSCRA